MSTIQTAITAISFFVHVLKVIMPWVADVQKYCHQVPIYELFPGQIMTHIYKQNMFIANFTLSYHIILLLTNKPYQNNVENYLRL